MNRAGTIFNYDIPYNPTRVIQRVGRINRINKKVFNELYICNYFPSLFGEGETNVRNISDIKMKMINWIFGEDTKYLTEKDELRKSLDSINTEDEIVNWDTKYIKELEDIKRDFKTEYEEAIQLPSKMHIAREQKDSKYKGVLVFSRKGGVPIFSFCDTDTRKVNNLTHEDAIELFKANLEDKDKKLSADFFPCYEEIKEYIKQPQGITLQPSNIIRRANTALQNIEQKIQECNYKHDINIGYFRKLQNLFMEHAFLSFNRKLKHIAEAGERLKNNNSLDDIFLELQESIPIYYLEQLEEQFNKDKTEIRDIVLSEEFQGESIKGELL